MPVDRAVACELVVGDVVRLDEPQAPRVERLMIAEARIVLELRSVGLAVPDAVRVTVPEETVIDRLGGSGQ